MGRLIYITEAQMSYLVRHQMNEDSGEVTYYQFKFPCQRFVNSLLKDPNPKRAELADVFTSNGISKETLERALRKHGIISSKQRISDDEGDKSAHYVRRYQRHSENMEQKMHAVYDELFGKKLNEDAGATCCASVGAGAGLDMPFNFDNKKKKKKGDVNEDENGFSIVRRKIK